MKCSIIRCVAVLALWLAGLAHAQGGKIELLLFCGITQLPAMTEIAQIFEKRENVRIVIIQGGSEDMYQAAKKSGVGDWYQPSEPSYRVKYLKDGLLGESVTIGYNQIALMVQKGNPKQVKADPRELLRKDLTMIIGDANSGSVGKYSKALLDGLGIYPKVIKAAAFLAPDSRSLVNSLRKKEADITLNWRATGFFSGNVAAVDVIDLDPQLAKPQAIELMLLATSKHPELARRFLALSASEEGQAVFRKHGFFDNKMRGGR